MLRKKYETAYLFNRITNVIGMRYNIRPDLDDPKDAEVPGIYTKETVAGFFRAYILNPVHIGFVTLVSKYGFLSKDQLLMMAKRAVRPGIDIENVLYQCVAYGLLFRNIIIFDNNSTIDLYGVDTGGYYAMEEAGIKSNKMLYTLGIDERITFYRKAAFLIGENVSSVKGLCMLEDLVAEKNLEIYTERVVLFDSEIAKILKLEDEINLFIKILEGNGAKIINISGSCGLKLN
ncbi:hypothetical protein N752_29785 [Desulforamulus aquiferis]|nr:hypothetical protein [Desulforamulus aquiferis]RYD01496.1 hypothetical protein N752_29785 [Desulforamulus aquiferis]